MRLLPTALAGAGLILSTVMPFQAVADVKIYPYHGPNYCPAGLRPVQIDGVICCGTPNQHKSYAQALAHPVAKKKRRAHKPVYSARAHCPAGQKGCS